MVVSVDNTTVNKLIKLMVSRTLDERLGVLNT